MDTDDSQSIEPATISCWGIKFGTGSMSKPKKRPRRPTPAIWVNTSRGDIMSRILIGGGGDASNNNTTSGGSSTVVGVEENDTKDMDKIVKDKEKKGLFGWLRHRGSANSTNNEGGNGQKGMKKNSMDNYGDTDKNKGDEKMITSSAWRKWFMTNSKDRILITMEGRLFQLLSVPMDGDCGFASVVRSLNFKPNNVNENCKLLGDHTDGNTNNINNVNNYGEKDFKVRDLRKALLEEVVTHRDWYEERLRWEGTVVRGKIEKFEKTVTRGGMLGHWLGQELGMLEFVALARAMRLWLEIFTFDVARQKVRRFEEFQSGDTKVAIFFSGPAQAGHFDCLIEKDNNQIRRNVIEPKSCAAAVVQSAAAAAAAGGSIPNVSMELVEGQTLTEATAQA